MHHVLSWDMLAKVTVSMSSGGCRVIRTCPLRFADSEEPVAADAGGAIVRLCRPWWPGVRTTWLQFYNFTILK